jgi:hypothetical protein
MTQYIYEFSGRFSMRVYKHRILKETEKTYQIQKTNWPFRLSKKNIGVKEWDGGFYSFDLNEVLIAAYEGIDTVETDMVKKVRQCREDIEQVRK